MTSSTFETDVTADGLDWEYDFRGEIEYLQKSHLKTELIDELNQVVGRDSDAGDPTTSIRSFCKAFHSAIPREYAVHNERASAPKKAGELRQFWTEQVGRPRYNKVININKPELAELLVALQAIDAGISRPVDAVPTTLPPGAERCIPEQAPKRGRPTQHPDVDQDNLIDLHDTGWENRLRSRIADRPNHAYVLDVTPPRDDEPNEITLLRRHTQAMVDNGSAGESLNGIYRAAYHLNNNDSVYYVGQSNDVVERIAGHLRGANITGSQFPHVFRPPHSVIEIAGADSKGAAEGLEAELADKYRKSGVCWAYFN